MVISQNKYQIQIPHAIWTLERHWYYAMTIFISQVTFIRNPPLPNNNTYIATVICSVHIPKIERQIIIETKMLLQIRILLEILH